MKRMMPVNALPERFKREGSHGWIDYYRDLVKALSSGVLKEEPTDSLRVQYDDNGEIHATTLGYIKARCFDQIIESLGVDKKEARVLLKDPHAAPYMRRRLIEYIENTLL